MSRTTKIIGFSAPPAVVREVERISRAERRTKSELFREMFRVYQRYRTQREQEERRWVDQLVAEAKREQREHPLTRKELLAEERRLARYGAGKAKKLGVSEGDIVRLIHESRARQNAS
jgi:metal-responsive CopG/Arc/MetJ family transcriptional regulator